MPNEKPWRALRSNPSPSWRRATSSAASGSGPRKATPALRPSTFSSSATARGLARLGRVCTICSHTQRYEIEELLATRQSTYRGIARKYGVSEDAVSRHVKAGHVSQLLAADAERGARADSLLEREEAF